MTDKQQSAAKAAAQVHAGFIPLVDCAPLVVAQARGFDRANGFELVLHKEVSWANIRDKVELGLLDCAHMLAPMPIAATLGIGHVKVPIIVPMSLGLNGNAITVSTTLHAHMRDVDPESTRAGGMAAAAALAKVVSERAEKNLAPLTFGMVYPFSCHNYELRYWLAAAGIDPESDVRLVVIPPPLMVESLKAGHIHGFCVGEPWNSLAVDERVGQIVATKIELWRNSPEKVLGMRLSWAEERPEMMIALIRSLVDAARWLDQPGNREDAARLLSGSDYLALPEDIVRRALSGTLRRSAVGPGEDEPDFLAFHRYYATFPWRSHGVWLLTQMIRWGQVSEPLDIEETAARVYRTDLYRRALEGGSESVPEADVKCETMFGGETFDPADPVAYIRGAAIHHNQVDLSAFEAARS